MDRDLHGNGETFSNNEAEPNHHCIGQQQGQEHAPILQKHQSITSMSFAPVRVVHQFISTSCAPVRVLRQSIATMSFAPVRVEHQSISLSFAPVRVVHQSITSMSFTSVRVINKCISMRSSAPILQQVARV